MRRTSLVSLTSKRFTRGHFPKEIADTMPARAKLSMFNQDASTSSSALDVKNPPAGQLQNLGKRFRLLGKYSGELCSASVSSSSSRAWLSVARRRSSDLAVDRKSTRL